MPSSLMMAPALDHEQKTNEFSVTLTKNGDNTTNLQLAASRPDFFCRGNIPGLILG